MLTLIPVKSSMPSTVVGQQTLTSSQTFTVPDGAENLCVVAVGSGGNRGTNYVFGFPSVTYFAGAGGGGALCWANALPVNPGDTIEVTIGARGSQTDTTIAVNGTVILRAGAGKNGGNGNSANGGTATRTGGKGGLFSSTLPAGSWGGGAGADGSGGMTSGSAPPSAGGAGGYSGKGGFSNGSVGGSSGSGGGGGSNKGSASGGVGLQGEGASGQGSFTGYSTLSNGSPPGPFFGGAEVHGGAVRFIWGKGRAFPKTRTADITEVA